MRARSFVVLALGVAATRAGAQTPATDSSKADCGCQKSGGWIIGTSLGIPGHDHEWIGELFTLGVTFTQAKPNRLVPDVSIGTMPYAVAFGVLPIGVRAGVALPIAALPHLLLIPSAGVSLVGVASPGGGGGAGGVNAGFAAMTYFDQVGIRAGVTLHNFGESDGGKYWLAEFGIVHVPLP